MSSITIPGNAVPWSPTDTFYPFTASNFVSPVSLACTPGQVITLTYRSGLVVQAAGAPHGNPGSYTPQGAGVGTGGGIFVRPSDRIPGEFNIGSDCEFCGGFANGSGALVATPMDLKNCTLGPLTLPAAPAGTTQLLLGVNRYSDWSFLSGSWVIGVNGPVTPGVIVTTTVDAFPSSNLSGSFVRFVLRNYAGQVPRANGGAMITITGTTADGSIAQDLIPNSSITPSSTFYEIQMWSDGRIVSSKKAVLNAGIDLSQLP